MIKKIITAIKLFLIVLTISLNFTGCDRKNADPEKNLVKNANSERDLVLYFNFDEYKEETVNGKTEITIKDCSLNGNDGKIFGEFKRIKTGPGNALEFNGDNYIDCGNKKNLDITDAITIEAWINPKKIVTTQPDAKIIMKGDFNYALTMDERAGNSTVQAYINHKYIRSTSINIEKWNHIVLTYDKNLVIGNIRLYINASRMDDKDYNEPIFITNDNLYIGGNGQFFHGLINGVKIYNRALTSQEIITSFIKSAEGKVVVPESFTTTNKINNSLIINSVALIIFLCLIFIISKRYAKAFNKGNKLTQKMHYFMQKIIGEQDSNTYLKISNGISLARITAMFWIFSVNYFSYIFKSYYDVEYQYAIQTAKNYLDIMNTNHWFIDKAYFVFAYAGWAGVVAMVFLSGFSMWLSILKSGEFKVENYVIKRFSSIYLSYFIAVIISFYICGSVRNMEVVSRDLLVLIAGGSRYVSSAYTYNVPLWFISILFILYLFFPLIPIIYKKLHFIGLFVFTLLCYNLWLIGRDIRSIHLGLSSFPYFWITLCIGVLVSHLIYKYLNVRIKTIKIRDILSVFAIPVFGYFLFKFIYLEPAINLTTTWGVKHVFSAGVMGALTFFLIGYVLPLKLYKPLRWLSRGTFGVFLYHYVILPFIVPYIKPSIFTSHLSIAMLIIYLVLLVCLSIFQGFLDKTVIRYVMKLVKRDYNIV